MYNISDPDLQHNNIQQQQRFVNPNTDSYLDSNSDTKQDLQNENENNSDKDINTLSNSMERLSVTEPNLSQTDTNTDKILQPELKKNTNIRFKFNNSDERNTMKLIARAGKATGKYSKAWNSQFVDGSIKSIDFETNDNTNDFETNGNTTNDISEEIYLADTYMTEMEKCQVDAKLIELENWNKQNVYNEENRIGQSYISTRWVITKKEIDEETITKARLCAGGFEETQEFRTDSPCCTRIGISFSNINY